MTEPKSDGSMRRPGRLVVAAVAAIVTLVIGWALGRALLDDDDASEADRADLAAAVSVGGDEDTYDALVGLASDAERWDRLVADGDAELVELLDRGHVALGDSSNHVGRAALVVAPLLDGDDVAADALAALSRWTWPILSDPTADPEATAAVFEIADRDSVHLEAMSQAMALAQIHIFSTADDVDFIGWTRELAAASSGSTVTPSQMETAGGATRLPAPLVAHVLSAWGRDPSDASAPLRDRLEAIGSADPRGEVGTTEAVLMAGHLRLIDDRSATGALDIMMSESGGAQGETLVGTLDRLMFNIDDPQVRQIRDEVRAVLAGG